jgi:hypothetical protein
MRIKPYGLLAVQAIPNPQMSVEPTAFPPALFFSSTALT